jgi:hypothetical protein
MFIVHLNRLRGSYILCTHVIPECCILKESTSVSVECEAEDFTWRSLRTSHPMTHTYQLGYTQTWGRYTITSTSVCSFPAVADGWFFIHTGHFSIPSPALFTGGHTHSNVAHPPLFPTSYALFYRLAISREATEDGK